MTNEILEKALKETWENKEIFYENNKNLSTIEIIKRLENKYNEHGTAHNRSVTASPPLAARSSVG
jgi:hypothetical protein